MLKKNAPAPRKEEAPDDRVRLPPLFGLRPGQYLACLYGVALLVILFFVLLFPGLSNPGSILSVSSEPLGAAVRVDDVYLGTSPCEVFVPRGKHMVTLVLPGFTPFRQEVDAPARLFGSLFFPKKIPLEGTLSAPRPGAAFAEEAASFAAWSFAGEPSASYQIPQTLSEAAYRLGPSIKTDEDASFMEDVLAASARFASSRGAMRDFIRAKFLLDNRGISPSPLSLTRSLGDLASYLQKNPQAALYLAAILQGEERAALTASSWYRESAAAQAAQGQGETPPPGKVINVGGLSFREIPGEAGLYIAERLINLKNWEDFTESQPQWKKENADVLIQNGLVDSNYLENPDLPGAPGTGLSGISWYGAVAYCAWLSENLPPAFAGWEARLPTEAEWQQAAAQAGGLPGRGDYWEWCAGPFAPLAGLAAPEEAVEAVSSPERSLRGGSWVNPAGSVAVLTRASLPPSSCSPFVSARPVLAPRRAGEGKP